MHPEHLKSTLLAHCETYVKDRYERIQKTISDIQHALTSETKSTAGDKHETGRAMLQLEREKAGKQLAEVQKLQETIAKISTEQESGPVRLGSIVMTSQHNYFISISVGEIKMDQLSFYAIAANSPIGKVLLGKMTDDVIIFNQNQFQIKEVM